MTWIGVCLLTALAAVTAALGYQSAASPTSTAARPVPGHHQPHRAVLGEAGGALPAGTSVFDSDMPGVAKLDPDLRAALRRAATDAATVGVRFVVDSGWRSPDYQEQLLQQAISKYGSAQEAARWVATPDTSPHVSGKAVDIGHANAAAWLSEHGAAYGLCQIYGNEPWHYELRSAAVDQGCPSMYADPSQDPRLRG